MHSQGGFADECGNSKLSLLFKSTDNGVSWRYVTDIYHASDRSCSCTAALCACSPAARTTATCSSAASTPPSTRTTTCWTRATGPTRPLHSSTPPGRTALSMAVSENFYTWRVVRRILDFRTAFGPSANFRDANYPTFMRIENFRQYLG